MSEQQNQHDRTTAHDTENDKDSAAATTAFSPVESRGVGSRAIAGFAAAGLLLAGAVGAWTLQSSNDTVAARQRAVSEQTSMSAEDSASSPSSSSDASRPSNSNRPGSPEASSRGTSRPQSQGQSNIAPLGNDPYLPPNAWDGAQEGYTAHPTETVYAEPTPQPGTAAPESSSNPSGNLTLDDLGHYVPNGRDHLWDFLAPQDRPTSSPTEVATPSETVTVLPSPSDSPKPTETTTTVDDDGRPGDPNPEPGSGSGPTDTTGG